MDDSSDQLLNALENERRHIARELHDGVAQTTLQLGLQAGICKKLLERGKVEMLRQELAQLEERVQFASRQIRDTINDLRPPLVNPDASLAEYLDYVLETHRQRGGPPVDYQGAETGQALTLISSQILALARVVQEALLNIRKHAGAEQVRLVLTTQADGFSLTIADNGAGFDPAEFETRPTDKEGAGLANLRTRIAAVGGTLAITRTPDGWTEITASFQK